VYLEDGSPVIARIESRLALVARAYAPDPRVLAALRIVFGIWVILFPSDVTWIADVPADFVNPRPGLFGWLSTPPDLTTLYGLMAAKVLFGAMVAVGLWTLPASVGLSIALICSSGVSYSFSKVDHFILFELAPVFLAFTGWGCVWSVDAIFRRRRMQDSVAVRGFPVLLYAMTIGWAMLSAAVPKVAGGWASPDRFATRGYVARDLALGEKVGPLGPWLLNIDSSIFWKFLDYATLIAEGGLIFVVFFPLLFRIWLVLVIGFHVGVYIALGINFADNLLAYAIFFAPVFAWVANKLGQARPSRREEKQVSPA
jgi:uncharacterized membrane protein YphA (DoxX/SURF4 family)